MTTELLNVPPMPGLVPVSDPRSVAQAALDAALAALDAARKSIEAAKAAKVQAQAVIDAAKPTIMLAEAQVTIAKAHLLQFGALPKGEGDKVTCEHVVAILQLADAPMSNEDIRAALAEKGVHADSNNLKAYMSRWAASGAVLKAPKVNRLDPARYYARPPLVGGENVPVAPSLPEDFPGKEHLEKAGYLVVEDVPSDFDTLFAIDGIGKATANAIVKARA